MANLYQDGDRVCLDLGASKREVLFSLESAQWCADNLDRFAGKATTSRLPGYRDREPNVEVDAIVNGHIPQVRLRFGWWCEKLFFTAQHAVNLAELIRAAGRKAEKELRCVEERDPRALLV